MLEVDLIRPVHELLAGHAAARGWAMAFRDDQVVRTWAQVYERTGRLAGHLGALGAPGGCVAIVMENRVELAESYLAVVRAGAVAACLNARAGDGELAFMIADCGAGLLITEASQLDRVREMLVGTGQGRAADRRRRAGRVRRRARLRGPGRDRATGPGGRRARAARARVSCCTRRGRRAVPRACCSASTRACGWWRRAGRGPWS